MAFQNKTNLWISYVFIGIIILFALIASFASYTAYHIELDGFPALAIVVFILYHTPLILTTYGFFLWVYIEIAETQKQKDICTLLYVFCMLALLVNMGIIVLPAIVRLL